MTEQIRLEIVAYRDMECSPFPCDENRTCGLSACAPTNQLMAAVDALRQKTAGTFHDSVEITLTLLDDGIPDYIRDIYESRHPPLPMILLNGDLLPIGRISWPQIEQAIRSLHSPAP